MCVDDVADITQFYSTSNTFTGNRGEMQRSLYLLEVKKNKGQN